MNADGATLFTAVKEDAKSSRVFPVKTRARAGRPRSPTGDGARPGDHRAEHGDRELAVPAGEDEGNPPIDPVSPVFALLLRPTDQLRFVPAANANGQGNLTFKVWVPDADFGTYGDTTGFGVDPERR